MAACWPAFAAIRPSLFPAPAGLIRRWRPQVGDTIVVFHDVKPGRYAVQVTHDENGNLRPDFPKEGFGFGNDMPFPPTFDGAAITVAGDTAARVHLLHMLDNGNGRGGSGAAAPEGATKIDLRESGLYGELYVPARKARVPLVIAIGGSEGGLDIMSSYAAPFARNGYAVLALAWWKAPGLPQTLENVPLEYFDRAIAWARARPEIAPGRIAILGWSRGAEAALLVGSRNPDIHAVIGVAPSFVVWQGLDFAHPQASGSAWTSQGTALPFVTPASFVPGAPMAQMFINALGSADARPDAAIPVEKINGPVLLLSGSEDRLWPSRVMAERIVARLHEKDFRFSVEHKNYAQAGHGIFVGDPDAVHADMSRMDAFMGGSPEANAAARADSWARCLRFLKNALR
jgi:dienelactone hydrolase